jgi:hypothetical protein
MDTAEWTRGLADQIERERSAPTKSRLLHALFRARTGCVHIAGITAHPNGAWVTEQTRTILRKLSHEQRSPRVLIRDRDVELTKFVDAPTVAQGTAVTCTYRSPGRSRRDGCVAGPLRRHSRNGSGDEAASLARQCDEDIATIIAACRPVRATRSATFFAGPRGSQSCS